MTSQSEAFPYPKAPLGVPAGFTEPSPRYRLHAALALACLVAFVALYLGLAGYFGWVVVRLVGGAISHGGSLFKAIVLSIPAAFFCAFLAAGLFVVRRGSRRGLLELSREEEPKLFAFIERLAREAGAPIPKRVFLSPDVNAAVGFDLSFWNLIIPSKKHLILGAGLVNALTLDEIKAVIAHELGHFAQRSTAVGQWVYVSRQIAGHIVASRTVFDGFLAAISSIDLRIAWIGWIARLFVWAIRALLDTAFRLVVLADRALSREMEFQADRVAVSLAGSDSIVNSLHKLVAADDAWHDSISFAREEAGHGRGIEDLYAVQSAVTAALRDVLREPNFGLVPPTPEGIEPSQVRVFARDFAQPPKMWSTHPPSYEREEEAKRTYLASPRDERPAWVLFADAEKIRRVATKLVDDLLFEKHTPPPKAPLSESLAHLADRFSVPAFEPRRHGVYMGRSVAAHHEQVSGMCGAHGEIERAVIVERLDRIYPAGLHLELKRYRELARELAMLEGLRDGFLTAAGKVIQYRGRAIQRRELGDVIAKTAREKDGVVTNVVQHDRECRAAHLDAARFVGRGWPEYVQSLHALLHFATHVSRDLRDVLAALHNVLDVVLADGRVSSSERARVMAAATETYDRLTWAFRQRKEVHLPATVAVRFEDGGGFATLDQELRLSMPTLQNLGPWLGVVDGWVNGAAADLHALSDAALDALLVTEDMLAAHVREGREPSDAPEPATVPNAYPRCVLGRERPKQKQLDWWDRFQVADGVVPGTLRFLSASALLLPALWLGARAGDAHVHIYNALSAPTVVSIDGQERVVAASGAATVDISTKSGIQITARNLSGKVVDTLVVDASDAFGDYVYNVAQAGVFVQWTAVYDATAAVPPAVEVGAPHWYAARQDHIFEAPPQAISDRDAPTRTVLEATRAADLLGAAGRLSPEERAALVRAHLTSGDSATRGQWLSLLPRDRAGDALVAQLADASPDDVVLQRERQDRAPRAQLLAMCEAYESRARARPEDGDRAYLALRCKSRMGQATSLLNLYDRFPGNPWVAHAATFELVRAQRWRDAYGAFTVAATTTTDAELRRIAVLENVRLARIVFATSGESLGPREITYESTSDYGVQLVAQLELGVVDHTDPYAVAISALARGELETARAATEQFAQHAAPLRLLISASDGAPSDLVSAALDIDAAALGLGHALILFALRLREHAPTETIRAACIAKVGVDSSTTALTRLLSVTDAAALRADPDLVQRAAAEASVLLIREQILAFGAVALGRDAPPAWRAEASAGLFVPERPFFGLVTVPPEAVR